jgi:hypothetical protein
VKAIILFCSMVVFLTFLMVLAAIVSTVWARFGL